VIPVSAVSYSDSEGIIGKDWYDEPEEIIDSFREGLLAVIYSELPCEAVTKISDSGADGGDDDTGVLE
jgi:hypothetical protein